jgi:hypothetical protein
MAVTHNRFTVGTAIAKVVTDSADSQDVYLQNLEPLASPESYARAGYLYIVAQRFTLPLAGTALFSVEVGASGLQIEGYEIVTTEQTVFAELVEGAAVTTTGAAIPSYNLNRNEADDAASVFKAATAVTGGSAISSELVTGSKIGGGGAMIISKIHTLEASTQYAMRFVNQTQQETDCYLQIIFSEKFNGQNDIWIGDAVGTGVRLSGGDTQVMRLQQGQTLWAVSEEDNELMVTRQD